MAAAQLRSRTSGFCPVTHLLVLSCHQILTYTLLFHLSLHFAGVKWMEGVESELLCNNPYVVFMASPPQPVLGQPNIFRLYFGMGGSYVGTAKVKVNPSASMANQ